MPRPTRNAFTPNKRKRTKEPYYEDIYGTRNPDEEAQGVHICDDSSSSNEETPLKKRAKLRSKVKRKLIAADAVTVTDAVTGDDESETVDALQNCVSGNEVGEVTSLLATSREHGVTSASHQDEESLFMPLDSPTALRANATPGPLSNRDEEDVFMVSQRSIKAEDLSEDDAEKDLSPTTHLHSEKEGNLTKPIDLTQTPTPPPAFVTPGSNRFNTPSNQATTTLPNRSSTTIGSTNFVGLKKRRFGVFSVSPSSQPKSKDRSHKDKKRIRLAKRKRGSVFNFDIDYEVGTPTKSRRSRHNVESSNSRSSNESGDEDFQIDDLEDGEQDIQMKEVEPKKQSKPKRKKSKPRPYAVRELEWLLASSGIKNEKPPVRNEDEEASDSEGQTRRSYNLRPQKVWRSQSSRPITKSRPPPTLYQSEQDEEEGETRRPMTRAMLARKTDWLLSPGNEGVDEDEDGDGDDEAETELESTGKKKRHLVRKKDLGEFDEESSNAQIKKAKRPVLDMVLIDAPARKKRSNES